MSSHLTYRPREGVVFGVVAGRPIRQATLRIPAGPDVGAWRGAGATRATAADNAALEIYDFPGHYAQRFDGVDKGGATGGAPNHRQHARVVRVTPRGPGGRGFAIHGPPACGNAHCIVVAQQWETLFSALSTARRISIVVEVQ